MNFHRRNKVDNGHTLYEILCSTLMWIIDRWSPYSLRNSSKTLLTDQNGKSEFNMKMSDCLWFCLMSLTPQGANKIPKCV